MLVDARLDSRPLPQEWAESAALFDAEVIWKWSSGRQSGWFSLTPIARFMRASPPQLFRVWREAALVQQMALKRADFVRAFRSREPREHSLCGTFRSAACSILYVSITRVRARV